MLACPECGELGIPEHSVQVTKEALVASPTKPPAHVRCRSCARVFARPGPDTLEPADDSALDGQPLWILPPWKGAKGSVTDDFELSWDVMEAFFERDLEAIDLRPLRAFLGELRAEGYGSKLRAGQSLNVLVLSRSREHGLREGQSHLTFAPYPDGLVRIDGTIGGVTHRMNEVPAVYKGRIRMAIEKLAEQPID